MRLSKLAFKNISWASASQIGRQIIQYSTTLVLVYNLDPKDFGLMALAIMIVNFLEVFKDLGTGAAIIQKPDISEKFLSSVFWTNIIIGFTVALIMIFISNLAGYFFHNYQLPDVLKVMSLAFIVSSFGITNRSLLQKEHKFKYISISEIMASIFGAITAILLAINGFGVWALVFQSLVSISITTILSWWFYRWRPQLFFNMVEIKKISKFSLNQTGYNTANYFARNLDYFLIGKFLGDYYLGHYYLAYRLMLYPVQNISAVVSKVMYPIFSSIQNDNNRFRRIYLKISGVVAGIAFPMIVGLAILSKPFVETFFSKQWNEELLVMLIVVLAPVGIMQSLTSLTGNIYQAKGRTDLMFGWGIATAILSAIAFYIGLNWGVVGVAVAYLIITSLWNYHCFAIPFKLIGLKFYNLIETIVKSLLITFIMAIIVYGSYAMIFYNISSLIALIISCLMGIIVYLIFQWKFNPGQLQEIRTIMISSK